MEYISSDTNVWIDFFVIGRTEIPFYLPYTFVMNCDAIDDELLSPSGLREKLLQCGLVSVELTIEEFGLAEELGPRYLQLSIYDRIALAIAIVRKIALLTGDSALRKAAKHENVNVIGTIGILDRLFDGGYINEHEYEYCLQELQRYNGQEVRLPKSEITSRLQRLNR
ncbi:MAG: PIN domain-containing protein [Bacillota bacterium]|nr:MAG: PIN domain-containing protein [Bacillota bacterium]